MQLKPPPPWTKPPSLISGGKECPEVCDFF